MYVSLRSGITAKCQATGERGRERVCRDAREGEKLKQTPARQNPNASLRWHYPDQVQRVFLTRDARSIPTDRKRCAAQDPRVSSRYVTPRRGVLATVCNTSSWARGASCIMASTAFPGYPGTRARRPRPPVLVMAGCPLTPSAAFDMLSCLARFAAPIARHVRIPYRTLVRPTFALSRLAVADALVALAE